MKKRIQILTVLLFCLLLLMPMQTGSILAFAEQEGSGKISPYLKERMADFDGPFPVYIKGLVPEEHRDILLPRDHSVWDSSLFAQYAANFQKELGLEQSEPVLDVEYLYAESRYYDYRGGAYLAAVWLTKEEIYRVAVDERVVDIVCISEDVYPFRLDSCDSWQALRILQASVGLHVSGPDVILPSRYYNINQDDYINALDALLALQESVGLIAIGTPQYYKPNHTGSMIWWADGYDWEMERMPENIFLCAGDENSDGVADKIDILIKCRDLWN